MRPSLIVLTVPHAGCFPALAGRHCDRAAEAMATTLHAALTEADLPTHLFINRKLRAGQDMNRPYTRSSTWRARIHQFLVQHRDEIRLHLDLHSFPGDTPTRVTDAPFYFIDDDPSGEHSIGRSLRQYLSQQGGQTGPVIRGPAIDPKGWPASTGLRHNDLQDEFRWQGVPSLLWEVREDLTTDQLRVLATHVVAWLERPEGPTNGNKDKEAEIVSPVSGVVRDVRVVPEQGTRIDVYIRGPHDETEDDHHIFAPVSGLLTFTPHEGVLTSHTRFVSLPGKTGFLRLRLPGVTTDVFVGSGYVTDTIVMTRETEEHVQRGDLLGEIVVHPRNSYAQITVQGDASVRVGDVLVGGNTSVGALRPT